MSVRTISVYRTKRIIDQYLKLETIEQPTVQEVIDCYRSMSPEAQENFIATIALIVQFMPLGFGDIQAIELVGALIKAKVL